MTGQTVSDVVAARIREVRKRRGLTPGELAERCDELGAGELTENVIENIEGGRRKGGQRSREVATDELLALALALGVAPVHLLVPPDADEQPYPVTATVSEPSFRARGWIRGLFMLRNLPLVGDQRQFFTEVPADEFDAVQQGQCPVCGGRPPHVIKIGGD